MFIFRISNILKHENKKKNDNSRHDSHQLSFKFSLEKMGVLLLYWFSIFSGVGGSKKKFEKKNLSQKS